MRFLICSVIVASFVMQGCNSSGTATGPSTNPDKPDAKRELKVKVPGDETIHQNGTEDVAISITRSNFDGPVTLDIRNLPSGVSVVTQDLTIPAGKDSLTVTLKAAANATVVKEHKAQVAAKAKEQKEMGEATADLKLNVKAKE